MHNLRLLWDTLSDAQQEIWRTFANNLSVTNRLGLSSPTTGFLLFMKTNLELRRSFGTGIVFPGTFRLTPPPTAVSASFSASGAFTVNASPPLGEIAAGYFVYAQPFWRTTPSPGSSQLVFLVSLATGTLALDVRPQWEEHFGPMVEGQQFAIAVAALVSAVRRSSLVEVRDSVAA